MTQTDRKTHHVLRLKKYCQNDYTAQGSLQIQWVPIKLSMAVFVDLEKNASNLTGNMEKWKPLNSQSDFEKENWAEGRNQAPWLQSVLLSYSTQNSIGVP